MIAEPANPRLPAAERGRLVRALARQAHEHPDGSVRTYSRNTLDRWIAAYQAKGLDGLRPVRRADAGQVRRHPELLGEAAALRAERPARSAAQIAEILRARHGITVSERTIRAHLACKGLSRAALSAEPARASGRYEAERPNQRWIGDVLTGPFVPCPRVAGSKRAKLFLLVDDHSRLLVHGRWVVEENTRAGQDVLRAAIVRRGLPEQLYVDDGAPYSNAALDRCCAVLGIRLVHSQPYRPQGRGKQERLNRVIRERFLLEAEQAGIASLDELNDRFAAWAEQVANTRVHSETGQTPLARWQTGGPPRAADPVLLAEAFRWSATRVVSKTATVSLAGNRYQVIYIPNPTIGTRGLYVTIVAALGGSPRFHKAEVMRQAADLLAAEEAERRRRVVSRNREYEINKVKFDGWDPKAQRVTDAKHGDLGGLIN